MYGKGTRQVTMAPAVSRTCHSAPPPPVPPPPPKACYHYTCFSRPWNPHKWLHFAPRLRGSRPRFLHSLQVLMPSVSASTNALITKQENLETTFNSLTEAQQVIIASIPTLAEKKDFFTPLFSQPAHPPLHAASPISARAPTAVPPTRRPPNITFEQPSEASFHLVK